MQLQGPQGTKAIPPNGTSYEETVGGGFGGEVLPEFYTPGAFVLKGGSQADDIGIFQANISIPQAGPQWTNMSEFATIGRNQDRTFTWSGIDAGTEYVVIRVQSVNVDLGVAAFAYCSADPAAGMFVVPRRVLAALPNSSPWNGEGNPTALVSVSGDSRSSTGQIAASGLVGGRLYYSNFAIRTTVVQ